MNRTGKVTFSDASLNVWEDPGCQVHGKWELQFKRDVFSRIVQQLNRLGWVCEVPEEYIKQYSLKFARNHRYCRKGDLQGFLDLSGRCIKLEMWQDVANGENPNGGRYDFHKEERMPYLLRLEMERTRRRLRTYLCNVFEGYEFESKGQPKIGPNAGEVTAYEAASHNRRTSGHYVPELDRARIGISGEDKSADGYHLENGIRVYAMTRIGRIVTGTAYYSLNGNWQIVTGKYGLEYVWHNRLWVENPGNLRVKRNADIRRKRLEQELSKAIKAMNFERAALLRDILFPKGETLFVVRHKEHGTYHRTNFCGYTNDLSEAGKFMADEVKGWDDDRNQVIPLGIAA